MTPLQVLCLDECDQMLEMGFRPALTQILRLLPKTPQGRQSLLFSATVPDAVEEMARNVLGAKAQFIDTVGEDDEQTHTHIEQESLHCSWPNLVPTMMRVLKFHMTKKDFKIIVFFPTARFTQYMATLASAMGLPVLEIHSRKSQSARGKASAAFLKQSNQVLFSSDVSARGMDYPGVTLVLQVGLTEREQYIHRLGRTARAGAGGCGLILLADTETTLLRDLKDVSVTPSGPASRVTGGASVVGNPLRDPYNVSDLPDLVAAIRKCKGDAPKAYSAWLGFYNSNLRRLRWDKAYLVETANALFATLGCPEPPALPRKTVGKMGLRGTPGLREEAKGAGGFGGGGRNGGGRGGGRGGGGRGGRRNNGGGRW